MSTLGFVVYPLFWGVMFISRHSPSHVGIHIGFVPNLCNVWAAIPLMAESVHLIIGVSDYSLPEFRFELSSRFGLGPF